MLKEDKLRLRCHKLHIKEKNIDGIWFLTCYDQDHGLDCQAYIHEILKSFKNQAKQINGHADINLILTLYVRYAASILIKNPLPFLAGVSTISVVGKNMEQDNNNVIAISSQTIQQVDIEKAWLIDKTGDL